MAQATLWLLIVFILAAPAEAQDDERHAGWVHAAIASAGVAMAADLATTEYALGQASRGAPIAEANVFLQPLSDQPIAMAVVKMGVAAGSTYVLLRFHKRYPLAVALTAVGQAIAFSWIAAHNEALIRRTTP